MRWVRAFAVTTVAVALSLGGVATAGAQESTTTTTGSTDSTGSTGSSVLTTTTLSATDGDGDEGVSTGTWVLLITVGLVLAALLLAAFTWRYWRATKPASASAAAPAADDEEAGLVAGPGRRSAPTP